MQHRSRKAAEQHFQGENSLPWGVFEMRILAGFQWSFFLGMKKGGWKGHRRKKCFFRCLELLKSFCGLLDSLIVIVRLLLALVCVPIPVCGPEFSKGVKYVEWCLFSSAVQVPLVKLGWQFLFSCYQIRCLAWENLSSSLELPYKLWYSSWHDLILHGQLFNLCWRWGWWVVFLAHCVGNNAIPNCSWVCFSAARRGNGRMEGILPQRKGRSCFQCLRLVGGCFLSSPSK